MVVDDGSTDGTELYLADLLRSWPSRRTVHKLRCVRLERNSGHAAAMNAGIRLAQGTWIKTVDDDDYIAPNCLEAMARAISLHPDAIICSCQASQVDSAGREIGRTPVSGPGWAYFIPQADIHYGMLLDIVPFGTPVQVAFRKDVALASGGWDSCFDTNSDEVDFWIRISEFGDAIFINECLAYRTIWLGSYSQRLPLKRRLATNYIMKQKIHALVYPEHRSRTPGLSDVRAYLNLHWGGVSLKHGQIRSGLNLIRQGLLSPVALKMLIGAAGFRRQILRSSPPRRIDLLRQAHSGPNDMSIVGAGQQESGLGPAHRP